MISKTVVILLLSLLILVTVVIIYQKNKEAFNNNLKISETLNFISLTKFSYLNFVSLTTCNLTKRFCFYTS